MPKPKLVVQNSGVLQWLYSGKLEELTVAEQARLREVTLEDELNLVMASEPGRLASEIVEAEFLLTENGPLPGALIRTAGRLRLIQNAGLRHQRIDLAACRAAGIQVAIVAMPADIVVAEHAMALVLALARKLRVADRAARRGEHYQSFARATDETVSRLHGKTLGIVGMGEIGSHVAQRALAFGLRVLYFNRHRASPDVECALQAEYRPLAALMAESDFIDIHLPLNATTRGLIGARELAAMKPTAYLVNTCRGAVLDENALVEILQARRIAGAALDVFVKEPLTSDHPFASLDNVILTPHIAGFGAFWEHLGAPFENFRRALRGEPLQGLVA